ncbi:MAG: glycosyltransferase family 2 protein [Halioglobus sp.]
MTSGNAPEIGIVVPCFNEEEILPETARQLQAKLMELAEAGALSKSSRVWFVDDGSTDTTWSIIKALVASDPCFMGIKLTRNHGHQYALYAGMMKAEGDALISMDADLQDDINAIDEMVEKFRAGIEIVYGVRHDRHTDGKFKRWTAALHYWVAARFGVETVPNHADFRLMSAKAVRLLGQYRETNIYLRGIVPLLGLSTDYVYYTRGARLVGETKYSLVAMLSLSARGITSFSMGPLRFIMLIGALVFLISLGLSGWALWAKITGNSTLIDGWASTVIPIYLLGGFQLLAIGIAGEYIGKAYMEVKNRPLYQVEEIISHSGDRDHD